mmetsp:Transcript_33298/g.65844  ORF Transcript_33298/g.65844 Transcript_33298/m.65844 type:complete len:84 (+) Transcript_33298:108-359(+)
MTTSTSDDISSLIEPQLKKEREEAEKEREEADFRLKKELQKEMEEHASRPLSTVTAALLMSTGQGLKKKEDDSESDTDDEGNP